MKFKKHFVVSIDGPASSGKSTIAKNLAKLLDCIYIDSGAMYRAVGLYMRNEKVDINNEEKVKANLANIEIEIKSPKESNENMIILNEEDVTKTIRQSQISQYASIVAKFGCVRKKMVELQREIAVEKSVVMDGRDIGSVVFPDADFKFYILASVEERAKRRWKELQEKKENKSYEKVLKELKWRDETDSSRKIAPLKKPKDAIEIDTTELSIEEQTRLVYEHIIQKMQVS